MTAAKYGYKAYRGYKRLKTGRRGTSGIGVTDHFDRKLIYRKKRMPRRKRRIWKKFVRKVKAVDLRELGTKSYVFNSNGSVNTSTVSGQCVVSFHILGFDVAPTTTGYGLADLYNVSVDIYGSLASMKSKIMWLRSCVLDITIQNTSVPIGGDNGSLEVDVYECSMKQNFGKVNNGATHNSFDGVISDAQANAVTTSGMTAFSFANRGTCPFNAPIGMQYVKIWKKTKYFISLGHTITYQLRIPKVRKLDLDTFNNVNNLEENVLKKGWTRGVLVLSKLTPGNVNSLSVGGLTYGSTRSYTMCIDSNEQVEGGFVSGTL